MTSSGEASVSYLCPQCQKKLTAHAEDAGQRRECPHCGKIVKVPGTAQASSRSSRSKTTDPSPTGGIANIPLICPLCGTRMYATKDQIGQTMVCPDCLESVIVPDRRPPKPPTQRPIADPDTSPTPPPVATGHDKAGPDSKATGDDDFKLSDPVELPRHRSVTGALADLIDQHVETHEEPQVDPKTPPPAPTAPVPPPQRQFAIKCPVCDTMLQVTEDEIGTMKECPDCFSSIKIAQPKPKMRRVNDVVESDYEDGEFVLDDPVSLDVYRPTDEDTAPRTVGEEALRNARLAQAEREKDAPELTSTPLWTGVLDFLPHGATITRIVVVGALLGVNMIFALTVVRLALGDASMQFASIALAFVTLFLTMVTVSYSSVNLLTVLQESAEGAQRIESWPENFFVDWLAESFPLIMAMFFAAAPGVALVVVTRITGAGWLFIGFSLYVCFPIAQLSILETGSLTNPISKPIIDSLSDDFLLWCTFYLITMFMGLAVGVALSFVRTTSPPVMFIPVGMLLSFAGFLYFRLLGRLAWTCQMRPLLDKRSADKQKKKSKSKRGESETHNDN